MDCDDGALSAVWPLMSACLEVGSLIGNGDDKEVFVRMRNCAIQSVEMRQKGPSGQYPMLSSGLGVKFKG